MAGKVFEQVTAMFFAPRAAATGAMKANFADVGPSVHSASLPAWRVGHKKITRGFPNGWQMLEVTQPTC
jgi:hypothetical protein